MGTVAIIHTLWLRRRFVAVAALVAVIAGLGIGYRIFSIPPSLQSKKFDVGTAQVRVLVDTPSSQVVTVDPTGLELLTQRANLLANLMVDGVIKAAIAKRAGIPPDQLHGVAQASASPVPAPAPPPRGYVLSTNVLQSTDVSNPAGNELPIIQIGTQAPTAGAAAKLADAAVAGVQDYLSTQATNEGLAPARRLRVTSLGAAQGMDSPRGPRSLMVFGAIIAVFALGCGLILLIPRLRKDWRRASTGEPDIERAGERAATAGEPYPMPSQPYAMPGQPYAMPGQPYAMPGEPYSVPSGPYPAPTGPYPAPSAPAAVPAGAHAAPHQGEDPDDDVDVRDDVPDLRSFHSGLRAVRGGMRRSGS